ncbi:MAG: NifU family protein [Gammaproteobacteria bacterium]|nr:NifU family protein [Gammaproteobacteria bacterium]
MNQPLTDQPERAPPHHLERLLGDVSRLEEIVAGWTSEQRNTVRAYRQTIDELNKEAFRRLIARLKAEPAALEALKTVVRDPLVYGVLRRHGLLKASLQERIEQALDSIRPMLASHGGDVDLVKVIPPDAVEVRFTGNCDGCPASAMTFVGGVKAAIEEHCPEIVEVRQSRGGAVENGGGVHFVSPFAQTATTGWWFAANLDEIPEQGILTRQVEGEPVILSRQGSVVSCFQDFCAHMGLPISAGPVHGGKITCPHHGFEYLLVSGECLTAPEVQLRTHAVRVAGDRVEVRLAK